METAATADTRRKRLLGPISLKTLEELRSEHHDQCLACNDPMFRLEFGRDRAEELVASFRPRAELCSYRGVLHGGVVSLLIDEAMTCCLMAHGIMAVTGELNLRYLAPVKTAEPIEIRSKVVTTFSPLYHVESKLRQGGSTKATAKGRFLQRKDAAS